MSFPRYPSYKDSGVEWLGAVPEHWAVSSLTRIATRVVVGIAEAATHAYADEGIPILRSTNIRAGKIVGDLLFIDPTFARDRESKLINAEDLITVRTGNAGVTAVIPNHLDGCQCFTMLITTLNPSASSFYYCYWMNSLAAQCYFSLEGWGTAQVNISVPILKALPVPLPPANEQTAIVEFLNRETEKIDELVAEQQRLMELLNEQIISLVLSSFDASETAELRLSEASMVISRPVAQTPDETYTRIGLFNRGRGLFHKDASEMDDMGESDFFWIEEGDLIISGQFAWEGAVALAGKEDAGCVVSHRYPVIRGKPGVALTEYLFGVLCTKHGDFLLNEHSRGAAGRNRPLNISSLMKEKIPMPNMKVQEAVARRVHARKSLFKEIARAIDLLQERRTALISAAVTGQIDVRRAANEVF